MRKRNLYGDGKQEKAGSVMNKKDCSGRKTTIVSAFKTAEGLAAEWEFVRQAAIYYTNLRRVFGDPPEQWIGKNLRESAQQACLSEGAFSRLFRRAGGTSYHRFRQQGRLLTALRYIESSDYSMTEIAFRVGFRSLWGLERTFRSWLGCTPLKYRHLFRIHKREDFARISSKMASGYQGIPTMINVPS
jgi:AraC-like DNA-binding protein